MDYKFVNIETDELLTLEQLESFFEDIRKEDTVNYGDLTFNEYVKLCKTYNNGSLEDVEKVTEDKIRHMLHDEYITQKTADIIANMDLYVTNGGQFYTSDGRYFWNYEDLNELAEL